MLNGQKTVLLLGQRINDRPWIALAAILTPYFVLSSISAALKPLWVDEQFTYYVAQTGSWGAIWAALSGGADNHPPLDYWLRSLMMGRFGSNEVAFRSLSIAAFGVVVLCVYRFVRRRAEPTFALIAVLVPFSTVAYEVAVDGRYQSLLLAWAAVALVSWQSAADGNRLALVTLGASLAAGLFTDYHGVLSFVPVVVGEVVRTICRRKVAASIWVTFAIAAISAAALLPLIKVARQYAGAFWTPVGIFYALDIYSTLFWRSTTVIVAFIACFLLIRREKVAQTIPEPKTRVPLHELAAAITCLFLPVICFVLAKLATGALQWRYVLETTVGAGILTAYSARRLADIFPAAPLLLLVCLFGNAVGHEAGILFRCRKARTALKTDNLAAVLPAKNIPVVLGYTEWSFQRLHYAPEELRGRVTYVYDLNAGRRFRGSDEAERAVSGLRLIGPIPVRPYSEFLQTTHHFWLMLAEDSQRWLVPKLLEDGATLTVRGTYRGAPIFEVDRDFSGGAEGRPRASSLVR